MTTTWKCRIHTGGSADAFSLWKEGVSTWENTTLCYSNNFSIKIKIYYGLQQSFIYLPILFAERRAVCATCLCKYLLYKVFVHLVYFVVVAFIIYIFSHCLECRSSRKSILEILFSEVLIVNVCTCSRQVYESIDLVETTHASFYEDYDLMWRTI